MKKIVFVLTMLAMVSTALGRVEISCVDEGSGVVAVYYDMSTGDTNLPRAFGLDIKLNNDANIVSTSDFNPDFWVHPGSIDVNTDEDPPVIDSNGSAILSATEYPQAGGLVGPPDANGMTIEMGSLYDVADQNLAPDSNGLLFKFTVDNDCNVTISGNTALGKVVLENTNEDENALYGTCSVTGFGGCQTCLGDASGDSWVSGTDVINIMSSLRTARDDANSPIYTGFFFYQCPSDGSYDCYDMSGDTWVSGTDVIDVMSSLREARDDANSPIYTGFFFYQCP
jgi:hypothetical protein